MWKTTAPVMKSLLAWVTPIMGNLSLLQVLTFYKAAIIVFSFFFFFKYRVMNFCLEIV